MRKTPAVAILLLVALAVGSAVPLTTQAQSGPIGARPAADDMPHRTARAFAPFIRAIILRRINQAQQMFKIRRNVQTYLETAETVQILGRFAKPDRLELNLVGGRTLGNNIGILYFTVTNEEGPVAFKIYYYGVGEDVYIGRMELTDNWDDIEAGAVSVEALANPITVNLGGIIDDSGQ